MYVTSRENSRVTVAELQKSDDIVKSNSFKKHTVFNSVKWSYKEIVGGWAEHSQLSRPLRASYVCDAEFTETQISRWTRWLNNKMSGSLPEWCYEDGAVAKFASNALPQHSESSSAGKEGPAKDLLCQRHCWLSLSGIWAGICATGRTSPIVIQVQY